MNKTLKAIKNKLAKFKDWCLKVALLAFQVSFLMIVLYRVIPVPITPFHIIRVFEQIGSSDEVRLKKVKILALQNLYTVLAYVISVKKMLKIYHVILFQ